MAREMFAFERLSVVAKRAYRELARQLYAYDSTEDLVDRVLRLMASVAPTRLIPPRSAAQQATNPHDVVGDDRAGAGEVPPSCIASDTLFTRSLRILAGSESTTMAATTAGTRSARNRHCDPPLTRQEPTL